MATNFIKLAAATGLSVLLLGATGPAAQQTRPPQPGDGLVGATMLMLDLNGDGVVDDAEIANEQDRLFVAVDVNGDGTLSVDEFRRNGRLLIALNVTTFFDMLDANGDGVLAPAEIKQPAQRWFDRYDADGDGTLDVDEVRAARLGIGN